MTGRISDLLRSAATLRGPSCRERRCATPSLSVYLATMLISCSAVVFGAALTLCGLFICHTEAVVGDGVVASSLGAAALIANTLLKGQARGL
jgi:hypothetical protein